MNVKCFDCNSFLEVCTILWDESGECAVCDPGFMDKNKETIYSWMKARSLKPVAVLLTHAHFDHIYGVASLVKDFGAKVYMHPAESLTLSHNSLSARMSGMPEPDCSFETIPVKEGDIIRFGQSEVKVIETPGHTAGGVSYLCEKDKVLVAGDTLFQGSIGRTDLPGGDYETLMTSIFTKLMVLDPDIDVIPGHGPSTTIADEGQKNPFLLPFNEPYEEEQSK